MHFGLKRACIVLAIVSIAAGCRPRKKPEAINFSAELPPGQLALRKINPEQYPDFSTMMTDLEALVQSIDHSLKYLEAPSSRQFYPYLDIDHARAVASLRALREIATQKPIQPIQWNSEIRAKFELYQSIGAPDPQGGYTNQVLFTGYFTPIYNASPTPSGPYHHPLYRNPASSSSTRPSSAGGPSLSRAQIESNPSPLAGLELVYLPSRWDAYVITIQGSARLRLTDGQILEIGYAGNNGYEYTSPGRQMLADGVISKEQLSLRGLREYFQAHPEQMDRYLNLNQRYVFFTERPGGPFGALNVPVTPFATIATDKTIDPVVGKPVYPKAMPAFLVVPVPRSAAGDTHLFRGFMMDQDTGGAIKAAGRCDVYMGVGPQAEAIAGHQLHEGQLYYIALKPELVGQYRTMSAPAP